MLKNTGESYGLIAKSFHWLVGLVVIGLLIVGFLMDDLQMSVKLTVYFWHKSVGILVLTLMIMRLCWRVYNHAPSALPTHRPWEIVLAHIVHYALYAVLIAMPLTGWLMSSAKGYTVNVAGLFSLPDLVKPDKRLAEFFVRAHYYLAFTILGLLALHIAGALKHHFIDKDLTVRRMTWAIIAALLFFSMPAQAADKWNVDYGASLISFKALQGGSAFNGTIDKFTADITFSPDNLEHSKAVIMMDMRSAKTGRADLDGYIGAPEWFSVSAFPQAVFTAQKFESIAENKFNIIGTLQIKDFTTPLTVPFTFLTVENKAIVEGAALLNRMNFGLGTTPDFEDEKTVSHMVGVTFRLEALKE
ncbi:MAG: cytochrome B [Alphaproteobacteria bacterium]|nr:cytochrome B [Alphaproteobacteria bacterium]